MFLALEPIKSLVNIVSSILFCLTENLLGMMCSLLYNLVSIVYSMLLN